MPTRRAFLLASGTFAVGATLGGACGYAVGAHASPAAEPEPSAAPPPAERAVDEPLKPSGDVDLDELRRLAVKAPIEELVKQDRIFLTMVGRTYRKDEILWRGVERLTDEVLKRDDYPDRRVIATFLIHVIERGEPRLTKRVEGNLKPLKAIK